MEEKLKKVKPEKGGSMAGMNKPYYPNLYIDSQSLPEIKDWKVGEDYYLVVKVTQKSYSMRSTDDGEMKGHADFDIKEIGVLDYKEENDEEKETIKKKYQA